MARIRTIKPEFWDSPGTARASLRARLFFIAMWNWADDYGVGTANGKALIGFAFPNDDEITAKDFPTLRKEVADGFGVMFYEVEGRPYYAIPSWDKHQRTERKARRINPPPPEGVSAGQIVNEGTSAESVGTSDAMHGSSGVGTGEQGNRGTGEEPLLADKSADPDRFPEFWDAYGKKVKRADAEKKWAKAIRKADPDLIIAAAASYVAWERANNEGGRYIADPSTWLHGERWNDERASRPRPQSRVQQHLALAQQLAAEEGGHPLGELG